MEEVIRGYNDVSFLDILDTKLVEVSNGLDNDYLESFVGKLFDFFWPLAHKLRWNQDKRCFYSMSPT